ncbi:MAG: hydrogenase formation protein HypD [Nitrososphaerota archaeon]
MSFLKEFKNRELVEALVRKIKNIHLKKPIKICHVCGTHEWTIVHYGLRTLLPDNIELIAGPGCPVCITPALDIDQAAELALEGKTVAVFGDVSRSIGVKHSLEAVRSEGGDVKIVYSILDALRMAESDQNREVVFFAVGFETTAPATALHILRTPPKNFSILSSHRYVPPAVIALYSRGKLEMDGVIAPGHATTISGLKAYEPLAKEYGIPVVASGFEPVDVLMSIFMLVKQISEGRAEVLNQYSRSVTWEGNVRAMQTINHVFKLTDAHWRGIGTIESSGFILKEEFKDYDAKYKYGLKDVDYANEMHAGCRCAEIMLGRIKPTQCPLYMKVCKPNKPIGPCMVSIEGTCRIWATHMVPS